MAAKCPDFFRPCNSSLIKLDCLNEGQCCAPDPPNNHTDPICGCTMKWTGQRCEERRVDLAASLASMQQSQMKILHLSATISITMAVVALAFVAFFIIKTYSRRSRRGKRENKLCNLDAVTRSLSIVEQQIYQINAERNINDCRRPPRLFEVSYFTGKTVLLRDPTQPPTSPLSPKAHPPPPRCASAPDLLALSRDQAGGTLLTRDKRHKLLHLFSAVEQRH